MFTTFTLDHIDVGEATLRVRHGGAGPAVLLLHGHPRTHATWHRVAPLLAERFTVVCPDLRGYGRSSKPPTDDEHTPYSKRAMARDCLALMHGLGHRRFAVVGHDRGGYVAFRLAMDHPGSVSALVALDVVPIGDALDRCDARFATRWWHWFFLASPELPEKVIGADPDAFYGVRYGADEDDMSREEFQDYQRAIHDPGTVHAMCEDYRAGVGIDRRHDEQDRAAGRRLRCPTLVLWGSESGLAELYDDDVLGVWAPWAPRLRGAPVKSGHHLMEEAPGDLAAQISRFLSAPQ
ncbi:alpha/beta fold hydrolase [Plantactinospora sp. KBS50]|uniref:alpha/beta fold hydrolase n=1 Tax=Plantactinospora sp. KBS50 TaxID=2024580 RepID=UPI000BAB1E1A|nr:alpha/beta hydrolase [Plantactinospora sp. KBS50]ASW55652.1 alpha/beta hydrolase [Plantactinospora sp. KBS50]